MGELETVIELAKRRGFFWQSFSTYGGFGGLNDYAPLGSLLKDRVYSVWGGIYASLNGIELDSPNITPEDVLKASGHVERFSDVAVTCLNCHTKQKAENLVSELGLQAKNGLPEEFDLIIESSGIKCPRCGGKFGKAYNFNLMFRIDGEDGTFYMRPETAQGIFVNFKNLYNYNRNKLPMIVYQKGKGFRNEISPRQALIREREFYMAEVEVFLENDKYDSFIPKGDVDVTLLDRDGKEHHTNLLKASENGLLNPDHAFFLEVTYGFATRVGIKKERLRFRQHRKDELAHYSRDCWDLEAYIDENWVEITGISDRGTYDLEMHQKYTGKNYEYADGKIARVIEPASGIGRIIMAILTSSFRKRESDYNYLDLPDEVAPYRICVLPLQKKDGLAEKAREFMEKIRSIEPFSTYDESGAIGRRYARQDEIGTPYCLTVDYETLENGSFTLRERNTMEQIRIQSIDELLSTGNILTSPAIIKTRKLRK